MSNATGGGLRCAVGRIASMFFWAVLVTACGGSGDSGSLPVALRAVTITGLPSGPLAPMQTAQLAAQATYSDGSVTNVTATATWSSSSADVLTVSTTGRVTATGPGQAEVIANFGGTSGRAGVQVVALPAAYFSNGVEYAFDYQLDAQGRVANYRISRRPGITYSAEPYYDFNLIECTGNLHGDYECRYSTADTLATMRGAVGRLTWFQGPRDPAAQFNVNSVEYSYDRFGLARIDQRYQTAGFEVCSTTTLGYDAVGHLAGVSELRDWCGAHELGRGTTVVTVDGQGRMQRAEGTYSDISSGLSTRVTTWSYGATGLMERMESIETGSLVTKKSTSYTADADGWLTGRIERYERSDTSGASETVDTNVIFRSGRLVSEEQFTRPEPAGFYVYAGNYFGFFLGGGPYRVRYEWGRLPTEPTFVPRALNGLSGADYVGIISSHHR